MTCCENCGIEIDDDSNPEICMDCWNDDWRRTHHNGRGCCYGPGRGTSKCAKCDGEYKKVVSKMENP